MTRKRRTRKQKLKAQKRHSLPVKIGTKKQTPASDVKSQFTHKAEGSKTALPKPKKALPSEEMNPLASIKKDLLKSLSLATFIFVAELVIYLFW